MAKPLSSVDDKRKSLQRRLLAWALIIAMTLNVLPTAVPVRAALTEKDASMKRILSFIAFLVPCLVASAAEAEKPKVVDVWPGKPPGDKADIASLGGAVSIGNADIWGHAITGVNGTVSTGPNGHVGNVAWQTTGTGVQPGWTKSFLVAEVGRIDNERIALPVAARVPIQ